MPGVKKYQIFISSTYEDLKKEREIVQRAILSELNIPVGMEFFCASNNEQWDIIQETIDTSDYYVLIVGRSYGTMIESGSDKGISYTEKEFKYAVENHVPVLAFILHDDAMPEKKYDKEKEKREGLVKFKKLVMTGRTVDFWDNGDQLAWKVNAAITRAIKKNPRPGWIRGSNENLDDLEGVDDFIVKDCTTNKSVVEDTTDVSMEQKILEQENKVQHTMDEPAHLQISKIDPDIISKGRAFVDTLLSFEGGFTIADISKATGMSMHAAKLKISRMVADGDVEKYGAGRKTQYYYVGTMDYSDGPHIIYDNKRRVLKEGVWHNGKLYKGIEYDILIKDVNGVLVYNPETNDYDGEYDTEIEEIMPLRDKKYRLRWVSMYIEEEGLENYYVSDVLVDQGNSSNAKCEYTHIRKFESWLEENDEEALEKLRKNIQYREELES
jgi:hypothetical protein